MYNSDNAPTAAFSLWAGSFKNLFIRFYEWRNQV